MCINAGTCVCRQAHYGCVLCLTLLYLFNPLNLLLCAPGTPIEVKLGAEETAGSAGWERAQHYTYTAEIGRQIWNPQPLRAQQSRTNLQNQGCLSRSKAPSTGWGSAISFTRVLGAGDVVAIFITTSQYWWDNGHKIHRIHRIYRSPTFSGAWWIWESKWSRHRKVSIPSSQKAVSNSWFVISAYKVTILGACFFKTPILKIKGIIFPSEISGCMTLGLNFPKLYFMTNNIEPQNGLVWKGPERSSIPNPSEMGWDPCEWLPGASEVKFSRSRQSSSRYLCQTSQIVTTTESLK